MNFYISIPAWLSFIIHTSYITKIFYII
jgi:hypothetical protein